MPVRVGHPGDVARRPDVYVDVIGLEVARPDRGLPSPVGVNDGVGIAPLGLIDRGLRARDRRPRLDAAGAQIDHDLEQLIGRLVVDVRQRAPAERLSLRAPAEHLILGRLLQRDRREERARRKALVRLDDAVGGSEVRSGQRVQRLGRRTARPSEGAGRVPVLRGRVGDTPRDERCAPAREHQATGQRRDHQRA